MTRTIELERAYRATTYRVFLPGGAVDLRIDTANPVLATWLKAEGLPTWAILTACNPGSESLSESANVERQAALEVKLLEEGYEPFAGENIADDPGWPPEDTCFVPGIDRDVCMALASQFGQNAFVIGEADGVPRLVWIDGTNEQEHRPI